MKKNCKKVTTIVVCLLLCVGFPLICYGVCSLCKVQTPCVGIFIGIGIALLASSVIIIAFCLMDEDKQSSGERYLDDVNTGISVLRKLLELNKELK